MPITDLQFAVIAASAYRTTRDPENRILPPQGWDPIAVRALDVRLAALGFGGTEPHATSDGGLEAVAYQKGNEVVIAFSGAGLIGSSLNDWMANAALATGQYAEQLRAAARYCVVPRKGLPTGAQFSSAGRCWATTATLWRRWSASMATTAWMAAQVPISRPPDSDGLSPEHRGNQRYTRPGSGDGCKELERSRPCM